MYFLIVRTHRFFPSLVLVFLISVAVYDTLMLFFLPANLTAYVANVNPALTSHVLSTIIQLLTNEALDMM